MNLDPRIDHDAWWKARLSDGVDIDALRLEWREMNSSVTLASGEVREVDCHAGAAILLVKTVCEELGARFRIETFDWPSAGDTVCIRTEARHFSCVSSADSLGDLRMAEGAALAALARHRSSLFGSAPARKRRASP
jgi:hypothetical protein